MPDSITRDDIIGARITGVFGVSKTGDGWVSTDIHFQVDRGFAFEMPMPGIEWSPSQIPTGAEEFPDSRTTQYIRVVKGWFGRKRFVREPDRVDDTVARVKARVIAGVYCYREDDDDYDGCEPDCCSLLFDDGSYLMCRSFAPEGIGTGILYYDDLEEDLANSAEHVDFFEIPRRKPMPPPLGTDGDTVNTSPH